MSETYFAMKPSPYDNPISTREGNDAAGSWSFTLSLLPTFRIAAPTLIAESPGTRYCTPKSTAFALAVNVETLVHCPEQSSRYCSRLKERPTLAFFPTGV